MKSLRHILSITGMIAALAAGAPLRGAGPEEPSAAVPASADPVVGMINEEPVSAAEYRMVMQRQTALVYDWFKREKNMDDHPGYWSDSTGPQGPLAMLRERVRDELVRIKVIQGLAREKGLVRDTSFADFVRAFETENARRMKAKNAGEVVYGPVQYRLSAYYYICLGDLEHKLRQLMGKGLQSGVAEADIVDFYNENKTALGGRLLDDELHERIGMVLVEKQAEKQLATLQASARVKMADELLRPIVPRVDPVKSP